MALITKAQLKGTSYLPHIASDSTTEDTMLDDLIARVDRLIARYCGYAPATVAGSPSMESRTYTAFRLTVPKSYEMPEGGFRYDGDLNRGVTRLRFPFGPITSVTSLYNDSSLAFAAASLLASTDYEVDSEVPSVIRLLPSGGRRSFDPGDGAVKITCVAGYDSADLPPELVHAAGLYVRHLYDLGSVQGKTSVSVAGTNEGRRDETVPDVVRQVLAPFRLPYLLCGEA